MYQIWTLSLEGNKATKRQVVALAGALQQELGGSSKASIASYFPLPPQNEADLSSNTGGTWTKLLPEEQLRKIGLMPPWPDVLISCRPEVTALALSVKAVSGSKTKAIHIQDPNGSSGNYHFDISSFDLIIRQPQESIRGSNVISSCLALHDLNSSVLQGFRQTYLEVLKSLKKPIVAVLIGGSDDHVSLTATQFDKFGRDLRELASQHKGTVIILTSRRTGDKNREILQKDLVDTNNVIIDDPQFGIDGTLALADRFIVTAESFSMVSEALATGMPCSIYDFDGALKKHPLNETFSDLIGQGIITRYPIIPDDNRVVIIDELPVLAKKIQSIIRGAQPKP